MQDKPTVTIPFPQALEFPSNNSDNAEIHALLHKRRLGLKFSPGLERQFRHHHAIESAMLFRSTVFYVLLLYCTLGAGIMFLVPFHALEPWPTGYAGVGIIIVIAAALSRLENFHRHYEFQIAGLSFTGMAVLVALPFMVQDPLVRQLAMIGVIHGLVVVGATLGLCFMPALVVMVGGGTAGLLIAVIAGSSPDWLIVHRTFTGGCFIGAFLAWLAEKRSRQVFLQKQLLEMEKVRSDALAGKMQEMSRHDNLTGLANRRYFDEVLAHEWLRCRRDGTLVSLLFIDVDFFKPFNDHYGHQRGDACLKQVAAALLAFARRPGDIAARYGGEEFLILYPKTGSDTAAGLAGEILGSISNLAIEHRHSRVADHVTVSIGVASMVPRSGTDPEQLIKAADHALYQAKSEGRNRCRQYQPEGTINAR
jgi:diguanylate cyclase (GGDEF)-like protein